MAQTATSANSGSIQNVLLIVGAILLAGASITFLSFSWGEMAFSARAVLTGAATVVAFLTAWICSTRGLRASAETIGALAALMLYLDAWALRASGLMTWGSGADHVAFMNVSTGVILVGTGLAMRLVSPRAIGTVLVPLGAVALATDQSSPLLATVVLTLGAATGFIMFVPRVDVLTRRALGVSSTILLGATLFSTLAALVLHGALQGAISLSIPTVACALFAWFSRGQVSGFLTGITSIGVVTSLFLLGVWISTTMQTHDPLQHAVLTWPVLGIMLGVLLAHVLTLRAATHPNKDIPRIGQSAALTTAGFLILPAVVLAVVVLLTEATVTFDLAPVTSVDLVPALALFSLGAAALHRMGMQPRTTARFTTWPTVLIAVLLPLFAPSRALTLILWGVLSLVAALAVSRLGTRLFLRNELRVLTWLPLLPSYVLARSASMGAETTQLSREAGTHLTAVILVVIAALLVICRGWDVRRRIWLDVPAPHGQFGQGHAGPYARPAAHPSRPHRVVHGPPTPQTRAVLLGMAILFGAWGVTTTLGQLVGTVLGGFVVVAGVVLLGSLVVLVAKVNSAQLNRPDLVAILVTAATLALAAAPTLLFGIRASSPGWLLTASTGVSLLIIAHLAVLTFSAPTQRGRADLPRQLAAGFLPLACVAVVTCARRFDTGGRIEWPLVVIALVAVLPILIAVLTPLARERRYVLESVSAFTLLVFLSAAMPSQTVLGIAFLIIAAAALGLSFTLDRSVHVWTGTSLTLLGILTLSLENVFAAVEVYTLPVALLLCAMGWIEIRRGRSHAMATTGLAALVLPTVFLSWQSTQWRAWALVGASLIFSGLVVALRTRAGASPVHGRRLASLALSVGLLNLALVMFGPLILALRPLPQDVGAAGAWTAISFVLAALACLALDSVVLWRSLPGPRVWASGLLLLVLTIPGLAIISHDLLTANSAAAVLVILVVLWGLVALQGTPPGWPAVRTPAEFIARSTPALVIGLMLAAAGGPSVPIPTDVVVTLSGAFVAAVAVRAAVLFKTHSTWLTIPYGVVATVAPTSMAMLEAPEGWRVSMAILIAFAWLVGGLRRRWQAPVALGGTALIAQVLALVGPPALAAFSGLPGWAVPAGVGAVLLIAGLLYERQVATARSAVRKFSDLR